MSDQLYSVELEQETGVYHIFLSSKEKNKCKLKGSSVCEMMEYNLNAVNIGLCVNEDRLKAIVERYGRKICKKCLQELNSTGD
ncbi:MAG TPA: hypothetical protein PK358_15060 [Spirochaetota bacterium]|nr:hypothetical protein [Spirochaetota bacterium]HPJ36158.1 hypothetical protein [Spirochaetota bacterium]